MADIKDIGLADLLLDSQNPRHKPTTGQRDIIAELFGNDAPKLIELAKDVTERGLSPIDICLVLRSGSTYTVLEGNRRIAVLKVLTNPDLAPTAMLTQRMKELAQNAVYPVPLTVACHVVTTRDEGRHWIELRHTGERDGAGVVGWNAEATARFAGHRGSQSDKALELIDGIEKAFPRNASLHQNLAKVRKEKLTTLGRLISDPSVRDAVGIEIENGGVTVHYPAKAVERALGRIIDDLADGLTVTEVKSKEQRKQYIGKIKDDLPDLSSYESNAKALPDGKPPTPAKKAAPKKASKVARSGPLFSGLALTNLGGKVSVTLKELQQQDVDRFPNTCAAMIRVVLELAVYRVCDLKKWAEPKSLRDGVKTCLVKLDPTNKSLNYQGVRTGLADGTSLLAVATVQALLHNPYFVATGTEVRTIAANYTDFLTGLDSLV